MAKFKINDTVKIRGIDSGDSKKLNGQIGKIVEVKLAHHSAGYDKFFYMIDIEINKLCYATGIWEYELTLVNKEVKKYGIALFLESIEKCL